MKLPDVNLLIYGIDDQSPHHTRIAPWLEGLFNGTDTVGLSWFTLLAFVRLSTRARVVSNPLDVTQAFGVLEGWLALPSVVMVHPTDRHATILRGLLEPLGTAGNLTNDAHLAALAIEHGGEVCSADTDFARFKGLRWTNPLD